ncbi:MAG: AAA family ATPase, partial [Gammaproteobacteria bacterium]|nr:AAA family ATPase [Gammaproteobacteria bacterium]
MENTDLNTFEDIPRTMKGHFVLHFYAAVYRLVNHIRRLNEVGGEDLEKTFERYPFLNGYLVEMLRYMPQETSWEEALGWWETEITTWEKAGSEHLPLRALSEQGGINFPNRVALMIVGLVEEDSRFGTLFARLQEPLAHRRPCLELVGQMMRHEGLTGGTDPWNICGPLLSSGLIDVANKDAPRSEWVLRVPSILWDVVRGEIGPHPAPWCQYHPSETFPQIKELIFPDEFLGRLEQLPALVMSGKAHAIVLRGTQGSESLRVMGAVARTLGQNVIEVSPSPAGRGEGEEAARKRWEGLGLLCSMTRSLPVITYDLGPGEIAELPHLTGYKGPVGILMGFEGGLRDRTVEKAMTLTLPALKVAHRTRCWQEALAGYPVENLSEISERFHIPGGYIRQAASMAIAHAALDRREKICMGDVREACRALNRQLLDTLAARLEVEGSWARLVVSEATTSKLYELERRCHHREKLLDHLAPAFGSGCNRGVRALFTGPSGTGKTLAARILAAELGMDLYRVDLAAVINKYIGETEKNLHRVLSRAEELDVILLLDEGDALLGKRTEVKSANDRYANLETNYLLQRLENYQGIVVVTTNAGENIDSAF